jgi:hypothetical protein
MELHRLDPYRVRIDRDERRGMRTHVIAYASEPLLQQIRKDLSLEQAMNVATLPGIVGPSLTMPDIHQGYGFPIGGVAATDWKQGVVSPGGVGFDINCGVRLMNTTLTRGDVQPRLKELVDQIFRDIPCGTGGKGPVDMSPKAWSRCWCGAGPTWWSRATERLATASLPRRRRVCRMRIPMPCRLGRKSGDGRNWAQSAAATTFSKCSMWKRSTMPRRRRRCIWRRIG